MNTESLQKQFKAEYEGFFAKNDLVVSGCFTGTVWPTWVWHNSKLMRIKLKLPIKLYLWIHINQSWDIVFWNVNTYKNISEKFEGAKFEEIIDQNEEIIAFIKRFLKKHNCLLWLNINLLSEWWRGYSFSFTSTFASVLSIALYMLIGKITPKDLEKYEDFLESDIFKEITATAWQIELINIYGNAAWGNQFVFYKWYNPALFYCERFNQDIDIEKVGEIKYSFTPFTKLFDIVDHNYLPFDYVMIFSWLLSNTKKIEQAIQLDDKRLEKYNNFMKNDILSITKLRKNVYFLDQMEQGIYNQFINMFGILTTIVLESLKKIYTEGENNENINNLIDTINSIRYLFYVLERSPSDFIESFISIFHEESKNKEKIGMVNCYSSKKWGSYVIIMKQGANRKHFFDTLERMKADYPDMVVNYMSRIDGVINDGVVLEQYISQWMFSKYTTKDQVYVKTNTGENFLWNYNDIISIHKDGLLLDTIKNKIYLNGRKLNSSDIPSQTTTINVIDKLLDNIGKDIPNKEFEISSYSKNKNEMLGKIVLPLIALIEKETGENLPLICKGSIYDFYMKLNPSTTKLAIIKKI